MASSGGAVPDTGVGGPFQANTRIVAIVALTIAGVFVFIGLALSLARALQQRATDRVCCLYCVTASSCGIFPCTLMLLLWKETLEVCALQLRRKWLPHTSRRAPVAAEIARGANRLTAADTRLCVAAAGSSYAGKIGTRECCKWLRHT